MGLMLEFTDNDQLDCCTVPVEIARRAVNGVLTPVHPCIGETNGSNLQIVSCVAGLGDRISVEVGWAADNSSIGDQLGYIRRWWDPLPPLNCAGRTSIWTRAVEDDITANGGDDFLGGYRGSAAGVWKYYNTGVTKIKKFSYNKYLLVLFPSLHKELHNNFITTFNIYRETGGTKQKDCLSEHLLD